MGARFNAEFVVVLWNAAGIISSTTVSKGHARSVTTSIGSPWLRSAVRKNRRADRVSRLGETNTR
jgi:hypothetical protein